jgi:hypothetical protein
MNRAVAAIMSLGFLGAACAIGAALCFCWGAWGGTIALIVVVFICIFGLLSQIEE